VNNTSRVLAGIPHPASTIMLYEMFTNGSGASQNNEQFMQAFAFTSGFQTSASTPRLASGSFYHGNTENFLFVDGHVQSLQPAVVYTPSKVLWRALPYP
jgi:prepilin-type processing-associated H-X9-DG protein